jgi:hypothetical protein
MRGKWVFPLLVVVALVAGISGCGGSSQPSDVPSVTNVEERLFRVALPGRWVEESTPDPYMWFYRCYDESGEVMITASTLTFASDDERTQIFQLTIDSFRKGRTEMGQVTMGEVAYSESGVNLVATFSGSEDLIGRLFASKVVCTSHSCVVIDYDSYDAEAFDQRADSILDSVETL